MSDDDLKHQQSQTADEEITDEESPLGSMPKESEDIDQTLKSVGLPNDDNRPKELNSEDVLNEADKNQQ